jgi:hypothetical protein
LALALGCGRTSAGTDPAAPASAQADVGRSLPLGTFAAIREVGTEDVTPQLGDLQLLVLTLEPEHFMVRAFLSMARSDATGAGTFSVTKTTGGLDLEFFTRSNPGCDPANANDPSLSEHWIVSDVAAGGDQITVQPGQNASGKTVLMGRVTQTALAICPALGCFPRCDHGQKIVDGCPTCECN